MHLRRVVASLQRYWSVVGLSPEHQLVVDPQHNAVMIDGPSAIILFLTLEYLYRKY